MKERIGVTGVKAMWIATIIFAAFVVAMVAKIVLVTGNTDVIYVPATVGFFLLCIAYAEGCGRL
jgi:hypothetical protein